MAQRVTIIDVANLAHVHYSTASRALRGERHVSPETIRRVQEAAAELGYTPDAVARVLAGNEPRRPVVAAVVDETSFTGIGRNAQAFWFFLTMGMTARLATAHTSFVMTTNEGLTSMGSTPIDVIVALSITDEQLAVPQQLSDVPVVVERTRSHVEGAAALMGHDHSAIAESVCQLLSDRGARHIAFMPMSGVDTVSQAGGAGYALWAAANGMTPHVIEPAVDPVTAQENARRAVEAGADAIYSMSTQLAAVLDGVRDAGRRIPQDVQVVGLGSGVLEPYFNPPLTVVDLCGEKSGAAIADLAQRVQGDRLFEILDLPWTIVERDSTRGRQQA